MTRRLPGLAVAALALAPLVTACATAPKNAQLSADDWRSLQPLYLSLRVHRPAALLPYEPMGESATGAGLGSGQGAVLVLLTLPAWLAVDAGRYVAERGREGAAERGNARLDGMWPALVDDALFQEAFRRGVQEALPGIVIADQAAPPAAGELLDRKSLGGDLHFALRSDGRALLVHVYLRLPAVPAEFKCTGLFQCLDMQQRIGRPRFTTQLFFHSELLPKTPEWAAAGASPSRPLSMYDPSRHHRRRLDRKSSGRSPRTQLEYYAALWLADDQRRLRQAFADAAESLARLTRLAVSNEAPASREGMGLGRALFPALYGNDVYFDVLAQGAGRRVLRSRAEPVRGIFGMADPAAGHWFDVPDGGDAEPYTTALLGMGPTLKTVYPAAKKD